MKVAIIGTGAAGLSALRHLKSNPQTFDELTCFEMLDQVGGTWNYTDETGERYDGLPVFSSMYKSLVTNLPKEAMAFPDFPFKSSLPSYIHHSDVFNYLKEYAEHFKLNQFIMFNTQVTRVHPVGESRFQVSFRSLVNGQYDEKSFDAVFVCNGHYSSPYIPQIPGEEKFRGDIMHCHDYRTPEKFRGLRVACLGAKSSAQDISIEISAVASRVYLCHNDRPMTARLPDNLHQRTGIREFTELSIILNDDSVVDIDAFVYCTGYKYDFPFLTPECNVSVTRGRIFPLYKHIIHAEMPTLLFIGVCQSICPFLQFDLQVRFCLAVLENRFKLPSSEMMKRDIEEDFQQRLKDGLPEHHAHVMWDRQWPYNDELANLSQTQPIPRFVKKLFEHVVHSRETDVLRYRSENYQLIGSEGFKIIS